MSYRKAMNRACSPRKMKNRGGMYSGPDACSKPTPSIWRSPSTNTEAFARWFRGSAVVSPYGEPLVVYHGTNAETFSVFDTSREGAHFGTSEQAEFRADRNRGGGGQRRVIAVFLSIQNLLRLPDLGVWDSFQNVHAHLSRSRIISCAEADQSWDAWQRSDADGWTALKRALGALGFDGIVYLNELEGSGDSYIAFSPSQIKSATANCGAWDPANEDMCA